MKTRSQTDNGYFLLKQAIVLPENVVDESIKNITSRGREIFNRD